MNEKIKSLIRSSQIWQLTISVIIGAVLITNVITALFSYWYWHAVAPTLILLGTLNAILVPLILLPLIIRSLKRMLVLEEQNQLHAEALTRLEAQQQAEAAVQRRADEIALLYQLGIQLASGQNLYDTLLRLYTAIKKLVQLDVLFVAIYDEQTDVVEFPIYFIDGKPYQHVSRKLSDRRGLAGEVIMTKQPVYLPDMMSDPVIVKFAPVGDPRVDLHTFLGVPLFVNDNVIGMLSVQSVQLNAYSHDEIHLIENVAVQAAIAIDKARLLDQLKMELAERERIDQRLREREAILEAITFAAEQFLKVPDWRVHIDLVLERLGKTLNATHAYLFEDHLDAEGELVTSMRNEWTANGYPSDLDAPYFQNAKIQREGFEEQVATLMRGEPRIGNSASFNPIEKNVMDELGVKAILEVPIRVNERIWGAIGFDDFEQEREWSNAEVDALKIAAGILSAAIQRQEAESAVHESERIYRQAIEAAGAVPYYRHHASDKYLFMGAGIQKITGYPPEQISPPFWSTITQAVQMVGDLTGLGETEAMDRVRNGEFNYWKCDYLIRAKDGQSKWVADSAIDLFDETGTSYGSIGIMQDVTERKNTEARLRQREAMLEAITFAAEQFLKTADWRENIDKVLERLGKTIDATHAYMFEHHTDVHGIEVSSLMYEWTAPGFVSDLNNLEFKNTHPIEDEPDSTDERLRRGEVFVGNAETFPMAERERLLNMGIRAMVEVPIFVEGDWRGTIGFDDMVNAREWNTAEIDALKVAAEILGAAIQRQAAEAAVRESERIYRQAIEAAGAVPYYQDYHANRYIFMGAEIEKITGYKPEEVTVELLRDIMKENIPLGEGAGLEIEQAVTSARRGDFKVWKSDMRIVAKNGEERWLTDSAVELFDESLLSYASVGILQDVTDRKHTEANLRKREAVLEAITFAAEQFLQSSNWREKIDRVLEQLGQTISATHAYLFENHISDQGEQLTSIRYEWTAPDYESDLQNTKYLNMPLAEDGLEIWYETVKKGQAYIGDAQHIPSTEFNYLLRRGIKALVDVPIFVNGQWWGVMGFDNMEVEHQWSDMEVDVIKVAANVLGAAIKRQLDEAALQTELEERQKLIRELELKNAESETLRESITSVAATLEIADAVDRILEQLARVVHYNSASVQLIRGNVLEIVSSRGIDFQRDDLGMQFPVNEAEPSYLVIQGKLPYILYDDVQAELSIFTDYPHDQIHAWMAVPLKVKGHITGIIALDGYSVGQFSERDAHLAVTYANQVAIALENARLFSELQIKFAERQQLINDLENKNSELERFTYTVSHDLKSPLVTINGFLGYLEQDALAGDNKRLKHDIYRIQEAVKKMQNLLNELLELSRVGRVVNVSEQVPFNDLVQAALQLVNGRLEAGHVQVSVQPNLPFVSVDRPRLIEVLQNLMDNAAKYMGEQNQPLIEIGQQGEEQGQLIFYVRDNGIGIAPLFHERIFGLFNKLDPKSEGTGIGLALVKRILEFHGGRIWVESREGQGATFYFTLPNQESK